MTTKQYRTIERSNDRTIERQELKDRQDRQQPDNEDRRAGYALVNVLGPEQFEKDKEIIVYCASPECPASSDAAEELVKRGFAKISDYENGLSDWKDAGDPVEGKAA